VTNDPIEEKLYFSVIGAFYEVYNFLGFGFIETHYVRALDWELRERGHDVGREVAIRVQYKHLDLGFVRLDMVVDGRLIVEVKSTKTLAPYASRQIYNYLRASDLELGLLLHFGGKPEFNKVFCRRHPKIIPRMLIHSEHEENRQAENPWGPATPATNP
jgi:GxxExxY protein